LAPSLIPDAGNGWSLNRMNSDFTQQFSQGVEDREMITFNIVQLFENMIP